MVSKKAPVITIDGAGGTGKGTAALLVATRLDWRLLDSGALYRVLALAAQKHGVAFDAEDTLRILAENLDVQFIASEVSALPQILLEGQDVTDTIRTEKIGNAASKIGAFPAVRTALLERQRAFRELPGLVTDGRDMGTVIFPDAEVKIFLTASAEERANRRHKQLKQQGINVMLRDLVEELSERDRRDRERPIAPLRPADDAVIIDTDNLAVNEVVERIMSVVKRVL